ncbi:hypothetical protein PDESU_00759 [Pontiella desulfatans]|uniref:Uncharacterized protein n=1 Tax=Pontiella desulfatans TaxID=2750659 RepID=A0A6C2TX03_PONDE|nr:hypothetical protein [Pontiella desulfatans]VGO12208.1 hypothetical protein PDESU_00759 [Pontiella desulfatans]
MLYFGFPAEQLKHELFSEEGTVIQFGVPPCQIDLLNQISGVEYANAAAHTIFAKYGDVRIRVIGREDLLLNKSSTDRLKDKVDVDEIKRSEST